MAWETELAKCKDCGRMFKRKSSNKVRCDSCQSKHAKDLEAKYNQRRRKTPVIITDKHDPNVCKKISTCIYRGKMGGIPICNYLEIMRHKRPCGVKNCTVYKKGASLSRKTCKFYDD